MKEILDVYDNEGNITGKTVVRGDKSAKLNSNEHIALSIIFIKNNKNEFLIQKTSSEKGGLYSTTGGHVLSKETPLDAIKREVFEELGINISNDLIEYVTTLNYDMPLRYVFYLEKDIDIRYLNVQKEEVETVKYMTVSEINKLKSNNQFLESHALQFNEILKRLDL